MKRVKTALISFIFLCIFSSLLFAARNAAIRVDQEGYRTFGNKYVILVDQSAASFTVKRVSNDTTAFTGSFGSAINDTASGDTTRIGDFSSLTEEGDFYIDVAGIGQSFEFRIDEFVYQDVFKWLMKGFYGQRCGTSVNFTHRGTTFFHGSCHLNDATYDGSTGLSGNHDMTGGWHDAGDYGKYALNSGITTGELLLMYEKYKPSLELLDLELPYSGGPLPDVLTEIKYNLDWMLKMQHTTGGVFHKLSNGFPQDIMPENDNDTRYIFQISSCATGDFAAVAAIASRVFAPYDAAYAAQCLAAAENAWTFLENNPTIVPAGGFSGGLGGAYGDADDSDERLWAAVELFNATGNTAYNNYVVSHYTDRAITLMSDGGDDWKELHPLAYISYIESTQPSVNTTVQNAMKTLFQSTSDTFRNRANNTNGYKFILEDGDYYWGSNSVAMNRSIRLLAAADIYSDDTYKEAAEETLHYILGRNAMDNSYLTYVGEKYTSYPHHQPSRADGITPPWPGLLAGGPNQHYLSISPDPAKNYDDNADDYVSNEVAINWMAAYAYVLAAFIPTPGPTFTPTETETSICWPITCTFTETNTPTETPTPINGIYVNCGGGNYTDTIGTTWQADQVFDGTWGVEYNENATNNLTAAIANTNDDQLYNDERWSGNAGQPFEYKFNNTGNGWFMVTLKFAEHWMYSNDARRFNVDIEGARELSNFSIFEAAGGQLIATDVQIPVQVTDGQLNIVFSKGSQDNPTINAISIETYYPPTATYTSTGTETNTPAESETFTETATDTDTPDPSWTKTMTPTETDTSTETDTPTVTYTPTDTPTLPPFTPILVNAGGPEYTDAEGTWAADFGYIGGTAADNSGITVTDGGSPLTDDTLYETERYGSPSYAFDSIPAGEYIVTLKFVEAYWDQPGDRVFSVQVEGTAAVTNLDLVGDYGQYVAHDVTVQVMVTDGTLNITSNATSDGALFNAIKIEMYIPPTFTPTETGTDTNTPTDTHTFTVTETETFTETETETPVDTGTETYTNTETGTQTPVDTYTETFTETFTETETPVDTGTETFTQTETETFTDTFTSTPTETYTETLVPGTSTYTDTPSETATGSPVATWTFTDTYTDTVTFTPTDTDTLTNTPTETQTSTMPDTETQTPVETETFTETETETATFTQSDTFTFTPTDTNTDTVTETPTDTITNTPSETVTGSPVATWTNTDTYTETSTYTTTDTETPTYTESATPMDTHTPTFTDTQTQVVTDTNTPTETFTETFTHSATYSITLTYTYTPTDTQTGTPPHTWTYTYTPTETNTQMFTPTETQTTGVPVETETPNDSDTLSVTDIMPYPNPYNPTFDIPVRFKCKVSQRNIDRLYIRIYTSGYRLVKEMVFEEAAMLQIINREYIEYKAEDLVNLANGTYYYIIIAEKGGEVLRSKVDKLIILK